ncbi:MAG: hypothetical protein R3Y10_10240 [Ferrimonas sp.]
MWYESVNAISLWFIVAILLLLAELTSGAFFCLALALTALVMMAICGFFMPSVFAQLVLFSLLATAVCFGLSKAKTPAKPDINDQSNEPLQGTSKIWHDRTP